MAQRKCSSNMINEAEADIYQNNIILGSHQNNCQGNSELIYNTIEYRLLRFKIKNEKHTPHITDRTIDNNNLITPIRPHSSINNKSIHVIDMIRPSTCVTKNVQCKNKIIQHEISQSMYLPHCNNFQSESMERTHRKRTPSICISTADEFEDDINRSELDEIHNCIDENIININSEKNNEPRIASSSRVSDVTFLKVPRLCIVPENDVSIKQKVCHDMIHFKKPKKNIKENKYLDPKVTKESKGQSIFLRNSKKTNRKMALSSTIARTSFQTSSKNCILDPILQKVTVHIRNYKNPTEKVI